MNDARISIQQQGDGALTWSVSYTPGDTPDESLAALIHTARRGVEVAARVLAAPAPSKPDPGERITGPQIELVYRLARKAPGGDEAVRATIAAAYERAISDLDKTQASAVISWLKGEGPAPVPAIPPAAPGTARQEVEDAAAVAAGRPASAPILAVRPGGVATDRQIAAIFASARAERRWEPDYVKADVWRRYGCHVDALSKVDASAYLDILAGKASDPNPPPAPASAPLFPDEELFPEAAAADPTLAALRARVQRGMELQGWVPAQQINWLAGLFGDRKRDVTMLSGAELQQALDTLIAIHKARPAAASGKGAVR